MAAPPPALLLLALLAPCALAQSLASPMRFSRFAPAGNPSPRAYAAVVTNATSLVFVGGRVGSTPDAAPSDMTVAPASLQPLSAGGAASMAGLSQQAVALVPENLQASLGGVAAYAFGGESARRRACAAAAKRRRVARCADRIVPHSLALLPSPHAQASASPAPSRRSCGPLAPRAGCPRRPPARRPPRAAARA